MADNEYQSTSYDYQNNDFTVKEQNNLSQEQPAHGFAIASLVLGIVCFFISGIITAPLAIIFAAIAKKNGNTEKKATAGLVLGIIGLVFCILAVLSVVFLALYEPDILTYI